MMLTVGVRILARLIFVLPLTCMFSHAVYADPWIASVDQGGLPIISGGGVTAISSQFIFWGKNWHWANLSLQFDVTAPFEYKLTGTNQALNFGLSGHVKKQSEQQLVWNLNFNESAGMTDVIGGGISFKFDLATFGARMGEPELLPDNRGWRWGTNDSTGVEMRFDTPLASITFERGQKSEIRAYFYQGDIPRGLKTFNATLTITRDMTIGPTVPERFGLDDYTTWPTDIVGWDVAPVDLSFLNASEKPAGKHGFLRVKKDALVFDDGTPVRFWGTNVTAYAIFGTDRENVKRQAHRLSQLGFNLVRFHHQDSPWVNPNIFGDAKTPDTANLSLAMLEKLDWWIKCLKDEGLYVWLDLDTQRFLKTGDNIDHFAEISKGKPAADLKGFNYVNTSIQEAMNRFNQKYVDHINPFTGLAYKDDPAIVTMLVTNENDATYHYGNSLLPDKSVPWHDGLYMAQADAFAAKYALSKSEVWKSWLPGPSKLFLNDLEYRFDDKMIQQLHGLGVKSPIVTTSAFGGSQLSSLPALTVGDIIDAHSYGGTGELDKNPLYGPNFIDWLAAANIVDRPLSVSEWNVQPFPNPDRDIIPLYIASAASLQGWDALMQFAYSQQPLNSRGSPSNWQSFNDPALLATLPAAALLYRRRHVREASTTYVFAPTPEQLFNQPISPLNAVALRTAAEKGRLTIAMPQTRQLPWLAESQIPPGAKVITDPGLSVIDRNAQMATSDTGELQRNWNEGTFTINTPQTQAAMGWIGGKAINLNDVEIAVTTRNATVAVQSLSDKAISDSRAILISLGARSVPTSANQLPFHSEPVTGSLTIRAVKGLRLYTRTGIGENEQEIPITYEGGRYKINLDRALHSYWLQLR